MKKLSKSGFFALFVTAVLVLNQAVFLFTPANPANAEGTTTVNLTNPLNGEVIFGQGTVEVEVNTNIPDIIVELTWPGSSMGNQTMNYEGGNVYHCDWDTAAIADGEYQLQARAMAMEQCFSCETIYYYSNTVTVKVKNSEPPSPGVTVTLRKPSDGTTVAGQIPVIVELESTMPVDEVNFRWSGPDNNTAAMTLQSGTNEYQYDWDTTTVPDGKYTLQALAVYNGEKYGSNVNTVKVENNVVSPPTISVILEKPTDGATVAGQVNAYARVDTTAVVDKVILLYFGPSEFANATNWREMTPAGSKNEYQHNWDTTALPDGKYELKVKAGIAGQDYFSQSITVAMDNNVTDPVGFNIKFVNTPQHISGPIVLFARTDTEVDGVIFSISGPMNTPDQKNYKYTGISEGNNLYSYKWDNTDFPDGEYKTKAIATKDGLSVEAGMPIYINRDTSGVSGDGTPVCGIKEVCSADGVCSKISKTYNNMEEMTKDGAQLKYHGICNPDSGNAGIYLPECGVKKECSSDGVCSEASITYNNMEEMTKDGARLKYHGVCRDDPGNADFYLPECGVKEDCSSGACFEKKKTYDNKSQMIEQGAEFLYHGVCKSDGGQLGDLEKMCDYEYAPVCGEIKICEGDFCRVQIQTFSNMCKLRVNRGRLLHYGGCKDQTGDIGITQIEEKSSWLVNDQLDNILSELQELRNIVREQENEIKYLQSLVVDLEKITEQMQDSINNFITYGVDDNTKWLGAGERAAVIHSFKSAFNKLPENEEELSDVIKIANGRWPSLRSEEAEENARNDFKNIYKRNPDTENPNDNAAVTVMAYGLRQKAENRNLDSEMQGIKTFQHIYGYHPASTEDWNIMQAITYSGATR